MVFAMLQAGNIPQRKKKPHAPWGAIKHENHPHPSLPHQGGGIQGGGYFRNNREMPFIRTLFLICLSAIILGFGDVARAAEVYFRVPDGAPGRSVEIPVMIDEAAKLAGIKLVIVYDERLLIFREGRKSKQTGSLMHIINDKTPGRLVVVMAGARGISGKSLELVLLKFEIKKDVPKPVRTKLEITEIQLMSEDLKDIKATVKTGMLAVGNGPSK
jgi:hypothetical protein